MRRIFFYIGIAFFIFSDASYAQMSNATFRKKFDEAGNYVDGNLFSKALPIYLSLDSASKNNYNIKFKIGVCYLHAPIHEEKSIPYLDTAAQHTSDDYRDDNYKETNAPLVSYYYLAQAYHRNYQFDKAIADYKKFETFLGKADYQMVQNVKHDIEMCNNGKKLVADPVDMKVQNVGAAINSKYPDYSPVVNADESALFFTSRRKGSTGGKLDYNGEYFEDIYVSYKKDGQWQKAQNIGPPINTDGHEATVGISADGQTLYIYKDDGGDGNIYTSQLVGTKWTAPQKLDENVDSKYWEPSASVSPDGRILYFTSNRPGGFGGRDIYMSRKLPNGQWAKAENLGPVINTKYDEDAPYIQADGKTLYFSSKGHNTMGGFDIFYSVLSDSGTWSKPVNIGYPVNSTGDDIFFVPTADNKRAYYSSFKENGYGEKDIYMITFPERKEKALTVYKGIVKSAISDKIPEGVEITVTDNKTGELVGEYYPNSSTGKYLIILPPGKNYNISYQANDYLFHSENLTVKKTDAYRVINKAVDLAPIEVGQKVVLRNIFFDTGKATLKPESKTELEKLKKLLTEMPKLVLEISGHTDSRGSDAINLKLSKNRAQAVVDYLVKEGINKDRLVAKGYGSSQPIAKNKNADGSYNKAGMALNRRTEFKILSVTGLIKGVNATVVPDSLKPANK